MVSLVVSPTAGIFPLINLNFICLKYILSTHSCTFWHKNIFLTFHERVKQKGYNYCMCNLIY